MDLGEFLQRSANAQCSIHRCLRHILADALQVSFKLREAQVAMGIGKHAD
jgi:hypothetical protein